MRLLYILTALFFGFFELTAQELIIEPAAGNPYMKSQINAEIRKSEAEFEKRIGFNPFQNAPENNFNDCPPDFVGWLIEAEEGIYFDVGIDTLILGGGGNLGDAITLLNAGDLVFGTAVLDTTSLIYTGLSTVQGAGTDTIRLEFCRNGGECDEFNYVVTVRRKGKTIIAAGMTVDPETTETYCLGSEIDFPGEKQCSQFIDCTDDYDGEGQNLFSFENYNRPDSCVIYYSNRFPGTDTVCMVICDEFVICDTFKIPFTVRGDTLSGDQVFFDDFVYDGPYPNPDLWLDDQVYVNKTFAPNPPSYGMATFDGVDRKGTPYDFFEGVADKLTSKPIDISAYDPSDDFVLRFFVASKGYGKATSSKDSLVVEFRDDKGRWVTIDGYEGFADEPFAADTFPPFEFKLYELDDAGFFHKAFQFRFKAYSSPGGILDLWHVDYVWFGQVPDDGMTFNDAAFVNCPPSLLKNYTSMPWWHFETFENQELDVPSEVVTVIDNHHFEVKDIVGFTKLEETTSGKVLYDQGAILTPSGNVQLGRNTYTFPVIPSAIEDQQTSMKGDFPGAEKLNFESSWVITDADDDVEFQPNNTVTSNTPFCDYFAYDDGIAERQISFKTPNGGEQLAIRYHANVDDTLRAIRILFPHLNGNVQNQLFNLRVFLPPLEKESEPIYEQELLAPYYPNNLFDTLQGFTTYRLEDIEGKASPVAIPAGDFYISFMQLSAGVEFGIPLGYDVNNTCESCLFIKNNVTEDWFELPEDVQIAVSMRPVVGSEAPKTTSSGTDDIREVSEVMNIFPNPTAGNLFIQLKEGNFQDFKALIFNNIGQNLGELPFRNEINLDQYQNGIYYLQIINIKTNERFNQKIIIMKP